MKKFVSTCVFVLAAAAVSLFAQTPAAPGAELKVGDKAPDFALAGTDGKTHKLGDYKGKTVVLAWFPKAMTSGCTAECKSIRDNADVIKTFDVAYFMASVDKPEDNKAFADRDTPNFPLLSDPDKKVATAYGVLGPSGLANRWTFYIGGDGKILYIEKAQGATQTTSAGAQLAAKLAELGTKKK